MAEVVIEGLGKRFGDVAAVSDVSLTVAEGEWLTLLGPSGCGKSTLLWMIAGLEAPSEGRITMGGRRIVDTAQGLILPPEARNCGLVFQSYALWPHMTVRANLDYPLKLRRVPKAERGARIAAILEVVELSAVADRHPWQLSGGQQQRVALARTLVYKPELLLLDEPLSNLDAKLRDRARYWLSEISAKYGTTTIFVTHDQVEALTLSTRIAVLEKGRIQQVGTPEEIYRKPATRFVADFVGTTSFLTGAIRAREQDRITVDLAAGPTLTLPSRCAKPVGADVTLAFRPEAARFGDAAPGELALTAEIQTRSFIGARYQYLARIGRDEVLLESEAALSPGPQRIAIATDRLHLF